MQITSFEPIILTPHAEDVAAVFEALGFEYQHNKTGEDFDANRMKDADGHHVNVVAVDAAAVPQDWTTIRMNVRDFDEAAELLLARGFKSTEASFRNTGSSKASMFISPSGFSLVVSEHIRD